MTTTRPSTEPGDARQREPADTGVRVPPPTPPVGDATASTRTTRSAQTILQLLTAVVAPTTLLTALLLFFGWNRTNELYLGFGVDASNLRFSTQDFMIRSVEAVYAPLGIGFLFGLLGLWGHAAILTALRHSRGITVLRVGAGVALTLGVGLLARGVVGVVLPAVSRDELVMTPLALGAGVGLLGYGRWLWRQPSPDPGGSSPGWLETASATLITLLIVLSVFWAVTNYAQAYGRARALEFAGQLSARPAVVVYSADRLFLDGPGVTETDLAAGPGDDAPAPHGDEATSGLVRMEGYRFRYDGLRLLVESGERYFLVPDAWTHEDAITFVVPDNGRLRLDLHPGGR
jgi:hypothetical protein